LLVAGTLACRPGPDVQSPAEAENTSTPADGPYAEELDALDDPVRRSAAIAELLHVASEIEGSSDEASRAAAAAALFPALRERWPSADTELRTATLVIAVKLAGPEAAPLLGDLIPTGSPAEVTLATEAVRVGDLRELGGRVAERLERELERCGGEEVEQGRMCMALIETLGDIRATGSVELLVRALEASDELGLPSAISRQLVTALGRIGDPRAVEALIAVQFRIADVPGTLSIGERAIRAIGAIGEPAVPGLLLALEGKNRRVEALAEEVGLDPWVVRASMARALGAVGSSRATASLLAGFPKAMCGTSPLAEDELDFLEVSERAIYANALGMIGDPAAVPTLCGCAGKSGDPSDTWEIAVALARIGGQEAFACLAELVDHGRYDPDLAGPGQEQAIRWDGFRLAVLAAPPSELGALKELRDRAEPDVREHIRRDESDIGIAVLEACAEDVACYREVLDDPERHSFERELAAFELARLRPGDLELAGAVAAAFATPDPGVRVNMAWLAGELARGHECPECVAGLEAVLFAEDTTKTATMQAAWIMARHTIDKARVGAP
jgi:HEAT repeat protein